MPNRFERHVDAGRYWIDPAKRNTRRLIDGNRVTMTPRGLAAYRLASARLEMVSRYADAVRYHLEGVRLARMEAAPLP